MFHGALWSDALLLLLHLIRNDLTVGAGEKLTDVDVRSFGIVNAI